jgi:MFS family permease
VFLLSRVPLHGTYPPDILPGMMIMGAGLGLVMVGVQNAANGGVPADKAGLAASLITASFQLGAALGLAIFVSLATGRTNQLLATHTQPSEALTLGFQRGLLGASIALVIAALIALRAPNVRVVDMAPDADDNQALPVPVAGGPAPEAPHFPAGRAELPGLPGRAAEGTAVPAHRKSTLPGTPATLSDDTAAMLSHSIAIGVRYMGAERGEEFGRRNAVPGELLVRLTPAKVIGVGDLTG